MKTEHNKNWDEKNGKKNRHIKEKCEHTKIKNYIETKQIRIAIYDIIPNTLTLKHFLTYFSLAKPQNERKLMEIK